MRLKSREIREKFLNFFSEKNHKIVPSAPIINKDDPTLMFTNAGMNQFKDYFLGDKTVVDSRVANSQKCLRVSGKHNDLEEVGVDSYHHTMFEMLGNWSFGDYFKKEAIEWAWELLTEEFKIEPDRLYVTIFKGEPSDGVARDTEALALWRNLLPGERILDFGKKDNFWEMGESGPCGPCSEIHVDLRSSEDREKVNGAELVNSDHPEVIEIWNLVFIQYDRKANGKLVSLPSHHVDTGMGFERLCMVLQGKKSSYDTDVFSPLIEKVESLSGKKYTGRYDREAGADIAFRVIVDHVRAVSLTIADGVLPANTGAGYVIRRILRRAIRYYYSFLEREEPMIYELVDILADQFKDAFPGLHEQRALVAKVIEEEERSFLRTLSEGLKRFGQLEKTDGIISGEDAFELYDTFGFPFDLTALLAEEQGLKVDEESFKVSLNQQRKRSKADAVKKVGDWVPVQKGNRTQFVGYDHGKVEGTKILRYRITEQKKRELVHLVLDKTPFYPEGGGQVGDRGKLIANGEEIKVMDTFRENELIVHLVDKLPKNPERTYAAEIDLDKRKATEANHSATHLLHAALKEVLGDHVQQKGSLVAPDQLRFDFSHFQKLSKEEIYRIEQLVNEKIRQNIPLQEDRSVPIETARERGATMLFGEKYGEEVRVITFDPKYSIELCGGCHVESTGKIGMFKITSETAIASGIRRIVAITGSEVESFIRDQSELLEAAREKLKNPQNILESIDSLQEELKKLRADLEKLTAKQAGNLQDELRGKAIEIRGVNVIAAKVSLSDPKALKTLVFNLEKELSPSAIIIGADVDGKPQLMLAISKELTGEQLDAGKYIRQAASFIKGGGGG
nr:alanine--tRNA ligase [Saprospiraceae bacterium]